MFCRSACSSGGIARALLRDQAFLLRDIEAGRGADVEPLLDQAENAGRAATLSRAMRSRSCAASTWK